MRLDLSYLMILQILSWLKEAKIWGTKHHKMVDDFLQKKLNIKYSPKHITITIPSDRPSLQRCYHTCVESQLWLCSPGGLKEHWRSMKTGSAMVMMHRQWIWYHDGYWCLCLSEVHNATLVANPSLECGSKYGRMYTTWISSPTTG